MKKKDILAELQEVQRRMAEAIEIRNHIYRCADERITVLEQDKAKLGPSARLAPLWKASAKKYWQLYRMAEGLFWDRDDENLYLWDVVNSLQDLPKIENPSPKMTKAVKNLKLRYRELQKYMAERNEETAKQIAEDSQ